MADRATEIAVLLVMSGTEGAMSTFSQKRSSCNNSRPDSHLHIYSKATDMKPNRNVLIGLVADQQKEMNRYTIQE